MLRLKGRCKDGYPDEGIDVVPKCTKAATIVKLLKEANERADKMQDEKDYWYRRHHDLYQDYIAMKFSDICDECKVKEESIKSGELILCQHCKEGRQTLQSLKIELAKKEELIRYWQDCYETSLQHVLDI